MKDDPTGIAALDAFRALVRAGVEAAIARDPYHKRFEGALSYELRMPPVVDWEDMPDPMGLQPEMQPLHVVKLYCYVLGPGRNYEWTSNTQRGVFEKATRDVLQWMREDEAEDAAERDCGGPTN